MSFVAVALQRQHVPLTLKYHHTRLRIEAGYACRGGQTRGAPANNDHRCSRQSPSFPECPSQV
jgi:hypothetical protein